MKKTFPLHIPGKNDARVIDAIKSDVRKYVKRERRKTLPEGFGQWDFLCRAGTEPATAKSVALKEISAAIDEAAKSGTANVYVEILASPAERGSTPASPA